MKSMLLWMMVFFLFLISGCTAQVVETAAPTPTKTQFIPTDTLPPPPTATMVPATETIAVPTSLPTLTPTFGPSTPWPTLSKPMPIVYFIGFRTDRHPIDDIEVRRAFAAALDRRELS